MIKKKTACISNKHVLPEHNTEYQQVIMEHMRVIDKFMSSDLNTNLSTFVFHHSPHLIYIHSRTAVKHKDPFFIDVSVFDLQDVFNSS